MSATTLEAVVAAEFSRAAPPEVTALAANMLHRHGGIAAILFYGSCRRTGDMTGLIDLYILYDDHKKFHQRRSHAWLNAMLPPNVLSLIHPVAGRPIRAKIAVMSLSQFERRMRISSLDTTIWTRFSQPASLIYTRDDEARQKTLAALGEGIRTAVFWARKLGPAQASAAANFPALFAHTYRLELRPERNAQPALLYQANAAWFDAIFAAAGPPAGANPHWRPRQLLGKPLNILRLIKAAFTYEGGADYIAGKLQRHAGIDLPLTDWQRRHPVLAAPGVLWRIRQQGRSSFLKKRTKKLF
jgi:hypothetical protein